MRRVFIAIMFAAVALAPRVAVAQEKYLLLAAGRTETLQNEINQAAERGFRVVVASRTENTEEVIVMERTPQTFRYRLIATTRTSTLEKELNEAVEAGYRVMPSTIGTKRTLGDVMRRSDPNQSAVNTEGELFVLMEKGPEPTPGLSYKVLATSRTGTLQREMSEVAEQGYTLLGLVSRREHIAIFERTK